jgi:hypothetical protein
MPVKTTRTTRRRDRAERDDERCVAIHVVVLFRAIHAKRRSGSRAWVPSTLSLTAACCRRYIDVDRIDVYRNEVLFL